MNLKKPKILFSILVVATVAFANPVEQISIKNNNFNIDISKLKEAINEIKTREIYENPNFNNPGSTEPTYIHTSTINPTTITSGCGTIQANPNESIKVLSAVFSKAMGTIGNYSMNAVTGYPDSNNPKQMFLKGYDMATTMVCLGEVTKVQIPETAIWMPFANWKHERVTMKETTEDVGLKTQINKLCGSNDKNPDEEKDTKIVQENKTAEKQAPGDVKRKAILGEAAKFKECKERYVEYYDYIEEKIDRYYALDRKKEEEIKGSCEVIKLKAKAQYKTDGEFMSPIYASNIVPETIKLPGIIESSLVVKHPTKRDFNYKVNRIQLEQSLIVPGVLPLYKREKSVRLDSRVYEIGMNYANMITTCINGQDQQVTQLQTEFNPSAEDHGNCEKFMGIGKGPFGYDLRPDTGSIIDFKDKVRIKEEFCRINDFRLEDDDFIIRTIGHVTKDIINQVKRQGDELRVDNIKSQTYDIEDLRAAIKTVVLEDWCGFKLKKEKKQLKVLKRKRISQLRAEVDARDLGILVKQPFLTSNELWFAETGSSPSVYKVCTKAIGQEKLWIAKIEQPKEGQKTTQVKIEVKKAEIDSVPNVEISEGYHSKYETEMFCDGVVTTNGTVCSNLESLRCGINWDKRTSRSDSLYYSNSSKDGNNKLKEDKFNDSKEIKRLETRTGETGDWDTYKEIMLDRSYKSYPTRFAFEAEIARSIRLDYKKIIKARKTASKFEHLLIDQLESDIEK